MYMTNGFRVFKVSYRIGKGKCNIRFYINDKGIKSKKSKNGCVGPILIELVKYR